MRPKKLVLLYCESSLAGDATAYVLGTRGYRVALAASFEEFRALAGSLEVDGVLIVASETTEVARLSNAIRHAPPLLVWTRGRAISAEVLAGWHGERVIVDAGIISVLDQMKTWRSKQGEQARREGRRAQLARVALAKAARIDRAMELASR